MISLPMTRDQWKRERELKREMLQRFRSIVPDLENSSEQVRHNTDWLLQYLYSPDATIGARVDQSRLLQFNIADEPVNWGDLYARVEMFNDGWLVTLEEAAAGECPSLCAYVRGWLERWGWNPVTVQTEW